MAKAKAKSPTSLVDKPSVGKLRNINTKRLFLEGLIKMGTVLHAAAFAGISRVTYYAWSNPKYYEGKYYDEEFTHECALALEAHRDVIRREMVRRAVDGVERNIYGSLGTGQGSGIIDTVTEYSDQLLIQLAKQRLPEAREGPLVNLDLRDKANGQGDEGRIAFDPRKMSKEARQKLRELLTMQAKAEQPAIEGETV